MFNGTLIPVYLTFPCCGKKSYRHIKVDGPCSKNFSLNHNGCSQKWNINIMVKWNKARTKLKVSTRWMTDDPDATFPSNFPKLYLNDPPYIKLGVGVRTPKNKKAEDQDHEV